MSCGEPSSNPTWLGREAARVGHDQPWCGYGRARTYNRRPIAIQRLAGRSRACVSLDVQKRVQAGGRPMAFVRRPWSR